MSEVGLRFEVDGEVQLSRFFELASATFEEWEAIHAEWAEDFRGTQYEVFLNEGAFEGRSAWAELSPRYRAWKDLHYPGRNILVLTGAMASGLTYAEDEHHVYQSEGVEMTIGVRSPYAMYHQRGTVYMPQRKVVELTQPQKLRWVQIARKIVWEEMQFQAMEAGLGRRLERRLEREL